MPSVQLNDVLSLGQHRIWKRMAVKWCQASAGQQALDVCCGSGDLAFRLAEAVGPSGQVYRFSNSPSHRNDRNDRNDIMSRNSIVSGKASRAD